MSKPIGPEGFMKTVHKRTAKKNSTSEIKVKDTFVEFLLDQLKNLGEISVKSMFGGKTLFCDGVAFALIDENVLYLKADDVNRSAFEALGLPPFRPFRDKISVMQYYQAPLEAIEDCHVLLHWCREAVGASLRADAKRKKSKKKVG